MEEPKTGPAQMICAACAQPFAPKKMVTMVADKLGLPMDLAEMCPRCRRARLAREIEDNIATTEASVCGAEAQLVVRRRVGPCDKE